MNFNLEEIFKVSVVLFAVIDILGSIPIILDIKRKAGNIHAFKATFVSLIIMLLFLFFGENLISIFGIGVAEFAVAGSFVLFFLAAWECAVLCSVNNSNVLCHMLPTCTQSNVFFCRCI